MDDKQRFDGGMNIRREVLGADYVDRAMAAAEGNDFMMAMQDLTTRYCWGDIWARPGLSRQQRSMINLAMIATLNRPHELKAHVKGALTNGLSKDEIKEILLQVAVYAGIPAGVDSFRAANEVFKELGKQNRPECFWNGRKLHWRRGPTFARWATARRGWVARSSAGP
jgi:4-carboxymuconolactone decarboxylase